MLSFANSAAIVNHTTELESISRSAAAVKPTIMFEQALWPTAARENDILYGSHKHLMMKNIPLDDSCVVLNAAPMVYSVHTHTTHRI